MQITFDRFDGGLMLARPSSVAPANSLSNLFNVNVQPGGWLRRRESWKRTSGSIQIGNGWKGLESNGGHLWVFGKDSGTYAGPANALLDSATFSYVVYAAYSGMGGGTFTQPDVNTVLLGTTRWGNGFVAVFEGLAVLFTATGTAGSIAATPTLINNLSFPYSGIMVTAGNRIYALDEGGLNVKFSAVGSATDWSTPGNAGFLPVSQHFGSGQKAYGLGLYQGKLAVFTDTSIQLWTIDPDPTKMALENVIDGVGTRHHKSIVSLQGDLLFLSESGVRSLTTVSNTLFPTDVDIGLPVKKIMPSPFQTIRAGGGFFVPSVIAMNASPFAQYWIAAPSYWSSGAPGGAIVNGWATWSYSRSAKLNAWATHGAGGGGTYCAINAWATLAQRCYMRHSMDTYLMAMTPDVFTGEEVGIGAGASITAAAAQTQWLDFKAPGRMKIITGIDCDVQNVYQIQVISSENGVRTGTVVIDVPVGSNQSGWTYSGQVIPVEAAGTEFQFNFVSSSTAAETQVNRMTVYYEDLGAAL